MGRTIKRDGLHAQKTDTACDIKRIDKIRLRQLRRGITPKLREFILGDGSGLVGCGYCGFPATEIDHVVPVSRGGGLALSNLAPACYECNHEKLDQTVTEWAAARRADGKPWPIPQYAKRLAAFLDRHNITPEVVGDDVRGWIKSWPGGYEGMRSELQRYRNTDLSSGVQ